MSFAIPITSSVYYMLGGSGPTAPRQQSFRLGVALIGEISALMVLWYVMSRQGTTWRDIGWNPGIADIPRAIGLYLAARVIMWVTWTAIQYFYRAYSGHFLAPKSLHSMLGFGISVLSIAFVCLNPFFEELIVRAFTISEVMNLGGSRSFAIAVSVLAQVSYHLYQGTANVLMLTLTFTMFSVYYARTRRIAPVILAHLMFDWVALARGNI